MTDQAYGKGTYKGQTRLALCGSSDVALEAFLERHSEVRVLHLDMKYTRFSAKEKMSTKI